MQLSVGQNDVMQSLTRQHTDRENMKNYVFLNMSMFIVYGHIRMIEFPMRMLSYVTLWL